MTKKLERSCGILLHVSSLPSRYGIGSIGREAHDFVDFLADAGQTWWQMLPLSPTGKGNSPYSSVSVFACNPLLIDLEMLADWGLLTREELEHAAIGSVGPVNYEKVAAVKGGFLLLACRRGLSTENGDFRQFCSKEQYWLDDYALFCAIRKHFNGTPWYEWPEELKRREPGAVFHMREMLRESVDESRFLQFLFFRQWRILKKYMEERGIGAIGDIPIYVSYDSSDVWEVPALFQMDDALRPTAVSGVPPDYFSAEGQLWNNPLYDWEYHRNTKFAWWLSRMKRNAEFFDAIRIDHFRGLEAYWSVPYGEASARNGKWEKGPGRALIDKLKKLEVGIIAEDLGCESEGLVELLRYSGFPGMRVLEFAFDTEDGNCPHRPHMYEKNCVAYTGTHDNDTVCGWLEHADSDAVRRAAEYLGLNEEEGYVRGMMRGVLSSAADLAVIPMQDVMCLGSACRMNTPSVPEGNWRWRIEEEDYRRKYSAGLYEMARRYGRI